ncbi:uroporphyrinogen decarboxylase [Compostimonas suwonensis]|uniref:Uroporphyrinogen decarboxylase n=1 Tax=Compostimonas suwonensis TaxID=1048394 RepID=A0A2M9C3Y2_9MICO|nr:uroporphyrinogen decarboxylase [Compostimonas suwonensis]PJJ65240.1 uroporphyrinogen decarboxylase [Compostimonas suwonensis]
MNSEPGHTLDARHPLASGLTANSRIVRAYQGERQAVTPVWFMRQAGRSLPEYRELRVGTSMLDACLDPAMASEITLQPVRRHGVDAGIFFSDIVIPLRLAGVGVEIVPGTGPVIAKPVRTAADVAELTSIDPQALDAERLAPIAEAVGRTVAELGETPLIGFAGAPFTLAAYLVEGGPSKDHVRARTLMHSDPQAWSALLDWAADLSGRFLRAQLEAGASAGQLFDSWAGALSLEDYARRVAPSSARALSHVRGLVYEVEAPDAATPAADGPPPTRTTTRNVPLVHFGVGTGELLAAMHDAGADVVGVDYRIPLDEASRRLGGLVPVQGNIDPALLAAPWPVLEAHVLDVIARGASAPAHVLNLGHGVPPDTDPEVLTRLVAFVHAL